MLAALLLTGIIAAPISSAALFAPVAQPRRTKGIWPALRRLLFALIGTVVLAAAVGAALRLLGLPQVSILAGVAALACVSLAWLPATRRWNARAHLCWTS